MQPTGSCENGRSSTITLRCNPEKSGQGKLNLPRLGDYVVFCSFFFPTIVVFFSFWIWMKMISNIIRMRMDKGNTALYMSKLCKKLLNKSYTLVKWIIYFTIYCSKFIYQTTLFKQFRMMEYFFSFELLFNHTSNCITSDNCIVHLKNKTFKYLCLFFQHLSWRNMWRMHIPLLVGEL